MPSPKKGARLGGSAAHQRLILANLSTQLFEHGRITTTEARARTLRPWAEKLITKAIKAHAGENALHQRREVLKTIRDKGVVHQLFTEIAPAMGERPGGYTRITKLNPRKGDNAPMAVIELVTEPYTPSAPRTRTTSTAAAAPAAPAAVVDEDTTEESAEVEVTDASDSAVPEDTTEESATEADAPTELADEASPEGSVIAEAEPTEDETKA